MGFRFQKRIKLMPGITLNLSRKGVSTSIGTTGARVTLGHGQTRVTSGLPGSGISHTTIIKNKPQQLQTSAPEYAPAPAHRPSPAYYKFGRFLGRLWERVFGKI